MPSLVGQLMMTDMLWYKM